MDWWNQIPVWGIMLGAGVLALVLGAWALFERRVNPTSARVEDPDAKARLTGVCGDTMEMKLKIRKGVVTAAGYWADGCGSSSACAAAATRLAMGKPVDDIPEAVDPEAIERAVGGLPADQRHCAALASETLNEAVHRYLLRRKGGPARETS
jgi:nitrogen fixation NifU-like protein